MMEKAKEIRAMFAISVNVKYWKGGRVEISGLKCRPNKKEFLKAIRRLKSIRCPCGKEGCYILLVEVVK